MMRKVGLTLCKSKLVVMEGPRLALRWWLVTKGGIWGLKAREIWEGRCRAVLEEEMHGFLFWLTGRIVDICPGDCQARTDLYH